MQQFRSAPILRALLITILLRTAAAPVPLRADTEPRHEYKVGVILGLTGPAAKWSKYQRMGIDLAVDDLANEGIRVTPILEDSRTEPAGGVAAIKKLIEVNKVDAVVGDIFSYLTEPLIPIAEQSGILLISPATPEATCARSKGHFFSSATQVPRAIDGYDQFLVRHPEVKKLALVYFDDPGWGHQYRDGWRSIAEKRGVEIVFEFGSPDFRPDFKSVLPRALAKKPDAFFVAQEPESFITTARDFNFRGPLVFANNVQEVLVDSGFNRARLKDVFFVDTLADDGFVRRFTVKFKEQPLLEPYNGYEALRAAVLALESNRKNPEEAMKNLKYPGISGTLDFTGSCAGNRSAWHLKRFVDGAIETVE